MKTIYTYYKNSNTSDLIMSQEFIETSIKFPINWYRNKTLSTEVDLTGYVKISEKHFKRLIRKK